MSRIVPIRPRTIEKSIVQGTGGSTWQSRLAVPGFVEIDCSHRHRSEDAAFACSQKRFDRYARGVEKVL